MALGLCDSKRRAAQFAFRSKRPEREQTSGHLIRGQRSRKWEMKRRSREVMKSGESS